MLYNTTARRKKQINLTEEWEKISYFFMKVAIQMANKYEKAMSHQTNAN